MPKIPVYTAQGQGTALQLPQVNGEAFGGQTGRALIGLGSVFHQIDSALQDQRDKLDLAALDADYQLGLDTAYQEALQEPDIQKQPMAFAKRVDALHGDLMKRPLSNAVRNTFAAHRERLDTTAVIALRHEGRALETERQIVDSTQAARQRMQQAAAYSQLGPDARNADIGNLAGMANALADGLEQNRHLTPIKTQALKDALHDEYWSEFSRRHPEELLAMRAGGPNADRPIGLDWKKLPTYEQNATMVLHLRQSEEAARLKQQEAEVKAAQQQNANLLTADVLEGKDVLGRIPTMLRQRQLDDTVGRTLAEVQLKMQTQPNLALYERGLATQMEATLSAMKYSPEALQDGLEQGIQSDFLQGKILKDEFIHLMSVWRGVQEYKHSQGHEAADKEVTHAHANLIRSLTTTGINEKYSALSGQTIKEAEQYYYRQMQQNPTADPWEVMQRAETIFKPVIEKKLEMSKQEKAALDDAKMLSLKERKAMSPAAYKAYKEQSQSQRGREAVQEALKNLPPPPEPGFLERAKKFMQKAPDRSSGIMGKE